MTKAYNDEYFNQLYQVNNGDPWQYEKHWYEKRKREITLAVLPEQRFKSAIEIGCSTGVLSEILASRCQQLLCLDGHLTAVQLAQQRLPAHVKVLQAVVPHNLPEHQFDLIVLSEVLYYLDEAHLQQVVTWLNTYLSDNGCIVACHWRYPIEHFDLNGKTVHQLLVDNIKHQHYLSLTDADFYLDLWTKSSDSLAQKEGLI